MDIMKKALSSVKGLRGTYLRAFQNPTPVDYDLFGKALSMCEKYTLAGHENYNGSSGIAYLVDNSTGAIAQTFQNPNVYGTTSADKFGASVGVCDTYSIVGAPFEDDATATSAGTVYIFSNATGQLLHTINDPNAYATTAGDTFGLRVAITENYAIVGTQNEDDAGGGASGKVYVFNPASGVLLYTLNNPNRYNTSQGDYFGGNIATNGVYVAVGATGEDDAGGTTSGAVYVFNLSTGALVYSIANPNVYGTSAGDNFSFSLTMNSKYLFVSAVSEDNSTTTSSGVVYMFDVITGAYKYTFFSPQYYGTPSGNFGYSMDCNENYIAISAYNESDGTYNLVGVVYVYDIRDGTIFLKFVLEDPNIYGTTDSDYFSQQICLNDSYVVVSAPYEDTATTLSTGVVYFFN